MPVCCVGFRLPALLREFWLLCACAIVAVWSCDGCRRGLDTPAFCFYISLWPELTRPLVVVAWLCCFSADAETRQRCLGQHGGQGAVSSCFLTSAFGPLRSVLSSPARPLARTENRKFNKCVPCGPKRLVRDFGAWGGTGFKENFTSSNSMASIIMVFVY